MMGGGRGGRREELRGGLSPVGVKPAWTRRSILAADERGEGAASVDLDRRTDPISASCLERFFRLDRILPMSIDDQYVHYSRRRKSRSK